MRVTQIKLFRNWTGTQAFFDIEKSFNDWVKQCRPEIIETRINMFDNAYVMTVFYKAEIDAKEDASQ